MKETKRALRRHHRQRMIQHALRSYMLRRVEDKDVQRALVLRLYNNLKNCSCYMCGNPRKFENRLTRQERRLLEAARNEAAED